MSGSISGAISGQYRDRISDHTGSADKQAPVDQGWRSNRIVSGSDILIASFLKGEPGLSGILYLAIGEGKADWDGTSPTTAAGVQQLSREILRHPIGPAELTFIDDQNESTKIPTHRLQIEVDFIGADIAKGSYQSLREFGLFGGKANDAINSGYLLNYVIHPRIDLTPNATLTRKLRLSFETATGSLPLVSTPAISSPGAGGEITDWLQDAPLLIIDGVGETYAARLAAASISTLAQLANADVTTLTTDIAPMTLLALRTKAALALRAQSELILIDELSDWTIEQLMATPIAQLVAETSETQNHIRQLTEQLGTLQLALDQRYLKSKTLRVLIKGTEP